MDEMNNWLQMAQDIGFNAAAPLDAKALKFLPEVRDMCSADRCNQYDRNWACPPACGSVDECAERAAKYSQGILVQSVGDVEDSFDFENMMLIMEKHKERFVALTKKLRESYPDLLPLGAGGCNICKTCSYPDKPCHFPDKAFPSMEAYGLLVNAVCTHCGLPYNYGKGKLAYTSCYLIK